MLATFDGPARAIRCASAVADVARLLGLEVRASLYAGENEMRGGDVSGLAVHIGARIGAVAGAGEVLVSGTVRDLVVGSGLEFDECAEHELRGIQGRWRLLAVRPERRHARLVLRVTSFPGGSGNSGATGPRALSETRQAPRSTTLANLTGFARRGRGADPLAESNPNGAGDRDRAARRGP